MTPVAVIPVTRTTKILGSIRPSGAPPASQRHAGPAAFAQLVQRGMGFVSTAASGGTLLKTEDLPESWQPASAVDPAPARAFCRELFGLGVQHCFIVGVTCVPGAPREKSTFAAALALALSASGNARVLLVDADFDGPAQQSLMCAAMPAGASFSQQIQSRTTRQSADPLCVLRTPRSLQLLLDGPYTASGLILSRTFEDCLRSLRPHYDFIVVDGPPGTREPECHALDGVIDGLFVVWSDGHHEQVPEVSRFFTTKPFSKAVRVAP
jgi:Mrp family chromosome partitioning ATPase